MKPLKYILTLCLLLITAIAVSNAQQVIGSFPTMDGGFENQTVGNLASTTSVSAWSVTTTSGTRLITSNSTLARTGMKYVTNSNTSTSTKRLQSPTTSTLLGSTAYTVQFFYRYSGTTVPLNYQGGIYLTTSLNKNTDVLTNGPSGVWNKITAAVTTVAGTAVDGFGTVRSKATDAVDMDVDDFVIYAGVADITVPNPATVATTTITSRQLIIGWTAPGAGVDGGGYMVVRGSADPTTTPNANGIYAIGNTVAAGEQVVYLGTSTSFTDGGLTPSTQYYYRIYTVDKAFNYSTPLTVNAATTAAPTPAALPTTPASNINFSSITQTSFNINWTSGNGSNRIVVMRSGSAVNSDPQQGNTYVANTAFGSGSQLGTGNYIVYNGTGSTVSITGLTKAIKYYISVYEYNGAPEAENYLTPAATAIQLSAPGEILSTGTNTAAAGVSWNTTTVWVGGVVPTQSDNVTVVAGDQLIIASGQTCYNLTIQTGAKVVNNITLPTTSLSYLRVYGNTVTVDGTLGGKTFADPTKDGALGFEFLDNLTFNGSGTIRPARIRPGTGASNVTCTFNADATLAYSGGTGTGGSGLYSDNSSNDNITFVVNSGKTLSGVENCNFSTTSSTATDGLANTTFLINGTLSLPGGIFGLRMSSGKTCNVTVNGLLEIGKDLIPTGTTGVTSTLTVNSGGELKLTGLGRTGFFDNPAQTVTGSGTFSLSNGTELIIGATAGLDPANGPIRTTTRNFSTGANYSFVGNAAQSTGSDVPSLVRSLSINNPLGVTLTNNVTIDTTLTMTKGNLNLGTGVISYNAGATLIYKDTVAQTTTDVEFPATSGPKKLTIYNAGGVTLHASRNIDSLTFTAGKLTTGTNSITVNGLVNTAGVAKYVDGTLTLPISAAPIVKKWELGQSSDYLPFTVGLNSVTGSDIISVSALDRNIVAPVGQYIASNKLLRRYFRVTKGAGITAFASDSLVLSFTNADVSEQGVLDKTTLRVFKYDGAIWSPVAVSRRDTSANTITVTGVNSFSDFVITGADMLGLASFSNRVVAFGNLTVGFTKIDSSVVITNNGAASLNISSITSNDPDLTVLPLTATLAPAESKKFYLTYKPSLAGVDIDTLVFTSNGMILSDTVFVNGTGVLPIFSLSAPAKSYGNVLQGGNKMDSVTVTNTGLGTMVISTVTSDNADFTVTPNANITLLSTETQKFYVTFTPSTVATKTGNVIFTYNNSVESPDTLLVDGIGSVPGFGLSTYLVDFGKLRKSKSKMDSVTVENTGVIALNITGVTSDVADFTVTPTSASVAPSTSQKFYITFAPTSVGLQSSNIRFAHDGSKPADTVVAKGTGIMPIYQASIVSGDFGNVSLGKSKTDSLYIRNIGTDTLHLDSLHHFRSEFTWLMTGKRQYAIAPGDSNKSVVTFTPVSLGAVKDTFVTFNDGANLQDTTYAQGVGVQSNFAVLPLSVAFANVNVSSTKKDSVVVTNSGTGTLTVDSVKSDNTMFTVTPANSVIAPAGTGKFYVTFTPTSTGAKSANILFYSNAPSVKDTVKVSGTGVQAAFALAPTTISFGGSMTGQTKKDSVVVTNNGTAALIIDSVKSNNAMITITFSTGTSIAPSTSFKFYLNFTPTSAGLKSAKVVFYHKGPSKTDTLAASGTGITGAFYTEDFTSAVGTNLTSAGWTISGTSTVSPIAITTPGLSIGKYSGSGVGNAATLTTTGQDVYASFPSINAGTVYLSFMMNVASAGTGDYFVALSPVSSQTNYYARLHIKSSGTGYVLGISKSNEVSGGAQYGTTVLNFNTTALVVVKYTFTAADTANDPINVYAFTTTVPTTEPSTAEISSYVAATKTDASDLAYITLRQGSTGAAPALVIDGFRVGTTWALGVPTAVTDMFSGIPTVYELQNNYPNPFNPSTTILYGIPLQSTVTVKIYSILGQEVKTLVNDVQSPSYYRVVWNGTDNNGNHLSSGVYFIRITAEASDAKNKPFIQVKKMLLMK